MILNWGVIGASGIAARRTIPEGLMPSPRCRLVAVMGVHPQRTRAVADRFRVPHRFERVQDLLACPQVEAVYVASPNYLHKEHVIAAARAGKHVLVEKPMALTVADAEEMVTVCQEMRVKLMVGYMMRFHAHHRRLREMIAGGELGTITFARAQLTCWYPDIPGAWRQNPTLSGGGAFIDLGVHCLDLLEMLVGKVRRLGAFVGNLAFSYPVEDAATVLLEFTSGAHGIIDVSFNTPDAASRNVLEVRGTRGTVIAEHTIGQGAGGRMVALVPAAVGGYDSMQERTKDVARLVKVESVNTYRAEVEHLVDCVEHDREPITGGETAVHIVRLTQLVYESARRGAVLAV